MNSADQDTVLEDICTYVKDYEIKEMLQEYLKRYGV